MAPGSGFLDPYSGGMFIMLGFCAGCFCILWLKGESPPRACSPEAPMGEGESIELFLLRLLSLSMSLFLFLLLLHLSLDSSDSHPDELFELWRC